MCPIALPVRELVEDGDPVEAERCECLDRETIERFLRNHAIKFVVAEEGREPRWIPITKCYEFWRDEVKAKIIESCEELALSARQERPYVYIASEWFGQPTYPYVLLEKVCGGHCPLLEADGDCPGRR